MKCPKCNKANVKIGNKNVVQEIKGQTIEFISEVHICPKCNFSFFDNDQADKIALAASNVYRKQNQLLTSEEIVAYRNHLGMTQQEFADFIPAGIASIKRWEGIGIQDVSLDQLIRLKCDPVNLTKAAANIDERSKAGIENGHRAFSKPKLKELCKILLKECKSPLFTNKGLYYTDFFHHKKYDSSITGSVYRKQDYGPVPSTAQLVFEEMEINKEVRKKNGHPHDLEVLIQPDWSIFDDVEQKTIREVLKLIKDIGYKTLVDRSHEEVGWLETPRLQVISYEYSKKLKGI